MVYLQTTGGAKGSGPIVRNRAATVSFPRKRESRSLISPLDFPELLMEAKSLSYRHAIASHPVGAVFPSHLTSLPAMPEQG